ncbi:hypothetical protein AGLY_011769 [Aphis glycines]|uniref:Uncharacterized protein n=1 Tax=Aphis glycines TaxID=307491 RepID=A0A6G0TB50_APHGL|nr:hypothetical protein AGLY_011769 [Aphis glycines]
MTVVLVRDWNPSEGNSNLVYQKFRKKNYIIYNLIAMYHLLISTTITSGFKSHARIKTKVWIDSEVVDGGTTSLSLGCNTNLTYNDDAGKLYILWELCNYLTNDRYRNKKNIYVEYDPILYAHQMTMHRIYDQHRTHPNRKRKDPSGPIKFVIAVDNSAAVNRKTGVVTQTECGMMPNLKPILNLKLCLHYFDTNINSIKFIFIALLYQNTPVFLIKQMSLNHKMLQKYKNDNRYYNEASTSKKIKNLKKNLCLASGGLESLSI